jgi:polar amino acid transport system permease protein
VAALVHVVRGLPLLMVVFWAYFFLPALTGHRSGHRSGQFETMLAALVVFNGAYLAEIVRAGIAGLPPGQLEAARSLGLSWPWAMRDVVLPQALRNALPSLVNQLVATIKATSLGYIIGLNEVSFIATQINTQLLTHATAVYGVLAASYFILCFGLSRLAHRLERRLARAPSSLP